jgi:hypothetical protein
MTTSNDSGRPRRRDRAELARHARGLLQGLGTETTQVASTLTDAGVRGQPADARQCALAVYLRAVMEGDPRVCGVRVFHDRLVITSPGRVRQHRVVVSMPPPVRAFVAGFDAQRYPGLVRASEAPRTSRSKSAMMAPGQS